MGDRMALLGVGVELPPAVDVVQHVTEAGGDPAGYQGWPRACHAGPDEHPSTLGQLALEKALAASGVAAAELDLVLYCGTSRDYQPSWSVSTEIMAHCGVGVSGIGIDTTAGCVAALAGLEFADGWLRNRGGGYAAVIAGERWTHTVDYRDTSAVGLWAHADGMAATIWGLNRPQPSLLDFVGAAFCNAAENNGYLRVAYGGTRAPAAPPGVNPSLRLVRETPPHYVRDLYRDRYRLSYRLLRERFDLQPTHLVLNQSAPGMVAWAADEYRLADSVTITGPRFGHLGGADIFVGIDELLTSHTTVDTVLMAASAPYGFGAGFLIRP